MRGLRHGIRVDSEIRFCVTVAEESQNKSSRMAFAEGDRVRTRDSDDADAPNVSGVLIELAPPNATVVDAGGGVARVAIDRLLADGDAVSAVTREMDHLWCGSLGRIMAGWQVRFAARDEEGAVSAEDGVLHGVVHSVERGLRDRKSVV